MIWSSRRNKQEVEPRFRLFFISAALLVLALCLLTYVEFYLEPSLEQELAGFIALVLGAIAGIGTIIAYILILWHRLKGFFSSEGRQ